MSDEGVKKWLSVMKKPVTSAVPELPATTSSSAAQAGASAETERDEIFDMTLEADERGQDAEIPATEGVPSKPALTNEQGPKGALSPINEERASAAQKGKEVLKRTIPPSTTQADKRQRVTEPGVGEDESVYRFLATGPSNDDMKAFLEIHKDLHPVAKSFMNKMDPETLSKEAQRSMVMVSAFFLEILVSIT